MANDAQGDSWSYSNRCDQNGLQAAVLRCRKQIEKLPHYYFSWIASFPPPPQKKTHTHTHTLTNVRCFLWNFFKNQGNDNLKATVPITDYNRSETNGTCRIFQLFV
jgi:hypothetical protein